MSERKLVAVTAGLSKPSSTRLLTDRLVEAVTEHTGAATALDVHVIELRDLAVDIANNLVSGWPSRALGEALERVADADALIVVTPVFAGSYSGLFKSFFDLVEPDALAGTPVLLAATGGTARHSLAVEHALRPLFSYLHALTLPTAVFAATDDWGAGADTYAGGLPARINRAGEEFAALLTRFGGDGVPHARRGPESRAHTAGPAPEDDGQDRSQGQDRREGRGQDGGGDNGEAGEPAEARGQTQRRVVGIEEDADSEVIPFEELLANI